MEKKSPVKKIRTLEERLAELSENTKELLDYFPSSSLVENFGGDVVLLTRREYLSALSQIFELSTVIKGDFSDYLNLAECRVRQAEEEELDKKDIEKAGEYYGDAIDCLYLIDEDYCDKRVKFLLGRCYYELWVGNVDFPRWGDSHDGYSGELLEDSFREEVVEGDEWKGNHVMGNVVEGDEWKGEQEEGELEEDFLEEDKLNLLREARYHMVKAVSYGESLTEKEHYYVGRVFLDIAREEEDLAVLERINIFEDSQGHLEESIREFECCEKLYYLGVSQIEMTDYLGDSKEILEFKKKGMKNLKRAYSLYPDERIMNYILQVEKREKS